MIHERLGATLTHEVISTMFRNLFLLALTLLIISNLFWVYQVLDLSVTSHYQQDSCSRYDADRRQLVELLVHRQSKQELLKFLSHYKLSYEIDQKDDRSIISLESFSLEYELDGQLVEKNIW